MDKKLMEQLTERAAQRERDRLEIKSFRVGDISMMFRKPSMGRQLEYFGTFSEARDAREVIALSVEMIYDCCEDLQNPELHKALGIVEPYDVVHCLMTIAEINLLGGELMQWLGLVAEPATAADGAPSTVAEETAKN